LELGEEVFSLLASNAGNVQVEQLVNKLILNKPDANSQRNTLVVI
jgi:hypothetical protein